MIALRDVTVSLPPGSPDATTVLQSVSLDIGGGEWVALLGPNGSGKTTLLHTIAGLVPAATGRIELGGAPVAGGDAGGEGASNGPGQAPVVSLLLQEPDNQFVTTSVRYELVLSTPAGMRAEVREKRIEEALERFSLESFASRNPHRLSGGEKQRLALATVWLQQPDVLLLDEPTAYLDDEAALMCREFVEEAHRDGVTVVWATPGGDALLHAERIVGIESGGVRFCGTIDELYEWAGTAGYGFVRPPVRAMAEQFARTMAEREASARFLRGAGSDTGDLARRIVPLIPEFNPADERKKSSATAELPASDAIVRFSSVGFGYGGEPVVRGLELTVARGDCLGISGRNGAGKSTVLNLASGVYAPQTGKLERRYDRFSDSGRQNVFYLFQSPERLFFAETVAEELAFGLERLGLSPDERARRSGGALATVGLEPESFLDRAPLTLSPGEMRRLAFAIAVALDPEFLLLDEPTSCLDPGGRSVLESIIADRRARGKTTMVASHDAPFLAGVCQRVVWIREGQVRTTLEVVDEALVPGAQWPGARLPVIELQDRLAELGVDVSPRAVTAGGLIERLTAR